MLVLMVIVIWLEDRLIGILTSYVLCLNFIQIEIKLLGYLFDFEAN